MNFQTTDTPRRSKCFAFLLAVVLSVWSNGPAGVSLAQDHDAENAENQTHLVESAGNQDQPMPEEIQRVLATGDGANLWFVRSRQLNDQSSFRIAHHHTDMGTGVARDALLVAQRPEAMIAIGDSLFVIFTPQSPTEGGKRTRQVIRTRVMFAQGRSDFVYDSSNRMGRIVASLPGEGTIAGVAHDGHAPFVLIQNEAEKGTSPNAANDVDYDNRGTVSQLQLLRFASGSWQEIDIPSDLRQSSHKHEARMLSAALPTLVWPDSNRASHSPGIILSQYDSEFGWHNTKSINLDLSRVESSCVVQEQTILALNDDEDAGVMEIVLFRQGGLYPIVQLGSLSPRRVLVHLPNGIGLMDQAEAHEPVTLSTIDITTGVHDSPITMDQRAQLRQEDLSFLFLMSAVLISMVIMFLVRPNPAATRVYLPDKTMIADIPRRMSAVLFDLLVSLFIISSIMSVSFLDIVSNWPLAPDSMAEAEPALWSILVTIIHSTLGELICGRTVGKMIAGCRVIGIDGQPASHFSIIVRNLLKSIVLVIPPLAAFVFVNPYKQRLGDLVAKTVVIARRVESDQSTEKQSDSSEGEDQD